MKNTKKVTFRYSESFKHQVVKEVEEGLLSCHQAKKKYGIKGDNTIRYWIRRMGKLHLLPKVIRVEKPDEKSRIKDLERQIKELKNALADSQVRAVIAESQFEIVCEDQGLNPEAVKKKLDKERLKNL